MEALFGTDFSEVRIHVGSQAESLGARAFTYGRDIFFAPGDYDPYSLHGQKLLAHELTHFVQQRSGRIRAPVGVGPVVVHDPALEAEADRMSARLGARPGPVVVEDALQPGAAISAVVQCKGALLTKQQATRIRDSQTYSCEITIDGTHNVKGTGGTAAAAKKQVVEQTLSSKIFAYEPAPEGDNPHAEDVAMYELFHQKEGELVTSAQNGQRWLSVTITAAPCARCARNLIKLAGQFKRVLRVKATFITRDGEDGLRLLAQYDVPFRVWTEEQKENSTRTWGKDSEPYDTGKIYEDYATRVKGEPGEARFHKNISQDMLGGVAADIMRAEQLGHAGAGRTWREIGFSRKDAVEGGGVPPSLSITLNDPERSRTLSIHRQALARDVMYTYGAFAHKPSREEQAEIERHIRDSPRVVSIQEFLHGFLEIDSTAREYIFSRLHEHPAWEGT